MKWVPHFVGRFGDSWDLFPPDGAIVLVLPWTRGRSFALSSSGLGCRALVAYASFCHVWVDIWYYGILSKQKSYRASNQNVKPTLSIIPNISYIYIYIRHTWELCWLTINRSWILAVVSRGYYRFTEDKPTN